MSLATAADANTWLDESKISMTNADVAQISPRIDAEVVASLVGLFPDHVTLWVAGTERVPTVVVDIASRLYAATLYAKKYSEESLQTNSYSDKLKAEAAAIIQQIWANEIHLSDPVTGAIIVASESLDELSFWPNDSDTVQYDKYGNIPPGFRAGDDDIAFTRDMVF